MEVEIIFKTSSTPKTIKDVTVMYEKGSFFCVEMSDLTILRFPIENIWQIASEHQTHKGSWK